MPVKIYEAVLTNDASGDATAYTGYFSGYVERIVVVSGNSETTTDLAVTDDVTGDSVLSKANGVSTANYGVRAQAAGSDGSSISGVYHPMKITDSRLKCVLDEAGATATTVTVYAYIADEQPAY